MSDLTEFLLARIADDEAAVKSNEYEVAPHTSRCGYDQLEFGHDCSCHWTARVLAECEAKRRIVETHRTLADGGCAEDDTWAPCRTLSALATVYADHPDYDETWRP